MTTTQQRSIPQSTKSTNLADLLERILDKGIVIAGDIKVKLVDVELLTVQIRLVICSVDKAKEIGIDWWRPDNSENALTSSVAALHERIAKLEAAIANGNSK